MVRIYHNWDTFHDRIYPCLLVCCDSLQEREQEKKKCNLMYKFWFLQNIPVYKSLDNKDIYSFKLFDVHTRDFGKV